MGCTTSQTFGFNELCNSIPGLLVDKDDQNLFYSLCKLETAGTISNILNPSSTQLFYVVISGEVNVLLSGLGIKPITAVTFTVGETIHFFNAKLRGTSMEYTEFGECLQNDHIKLSLHFNGHGRVIGMNRRGFDEFVMKASSRLNAITSFVSMNMADFFLISPIFQTMTTEQAYIFGPLLKLRLAHTGKEVGAHIPPPPLSEHCITEKCSTDSHTKRDHLIMLLHGGLLSVPVNSNLELIAKDIIKDSDPAGRTDCNGKRSPRQVYSVPHVFRAGPDREKSLAWHAHTRLRDRSCSCNVGSCSSVMSTVHESSHVSLPRGSIIGSDQYFVRNPDVRIRSYLTNAPSVLGYLPMAAMDALCQVDERFKRVYSRNMFLQIIHWVRPHVPFLADMDDWSLTLLSCKVSLIGKNTSEQVIKKGDPGNCAYIILTGAVKRATAVAMDLPRISPVGRKKEESDQVDDCLHVTNSMRSGRILKWGSLIGVTALTIGEPYYNNAFAIEPTLLLCMGKGVLDQIYYNDKAKLCEVRIRLMGPEVDLLHAIDHPTGSALFLQYLTKQLAAENLTFYKAVDKYDRMCRGIVKLSAHIEELRRGLRVTSSADEAASVLTARTHHTYNAVTSLPAPSAVSNTARCTNTQTNHQIIKIGDIDRKQINSNNTLTTAADSGSHMSEQSSTNSLSLRTKPAAQLKAPPKVSLPHCTPVAARLSNGDCGSETYTPDTGTDNHTDTRNREHFSYRVAEALSAGEKEGNDGDHLSAMARPTHARIDTATTTLQHTDPTASLALTTADSIRQHHMVTEGHAQEPPALLPGKPPRTRQEFLMAKAARIRSACNQHVLDTSPAVVPATDTAAAAVADESDGEDDQSQTTTVPGMYTVHELPTEPPGTSIQLTTSKFQRRLAKIAGKLQSLQQHIADLLPTAGSIMEAYIHEGAEHQLNLPYTMRIQCEQQFNSWCAGLTKGMATVDHNTAAVDEPLQSAAIKTEVQSAVQILEQPIDLSFVDLFKEAKGEVLKLLRDGMFPRWKNTPDFHSFIEGIKPYKAMVLDTATGTTAGEGGAVRLVTLKKPEEGINQSNSWAEMYAGTAK